MRSSQLHHLNYGAYIWYGAICSKSALSALPNSRVQSSTINFRICHPRSAFGNKADHLVVLRRADHAVARSQHGFAAVCDVLSATLSARSRRQAPDDRARPSRSADGIARGLSGERIERTEPAHRRTDSHAVACAQHGFVAVRGVLSAAELVAPRRRLVSPVSSATRARGARTTGRHARGRRLAPARSTCSCERSSSSPPRSARRRQRCASSLCASTSAAKRCPVQQAHSFWGALGRSFEIYTLRIPWGIGSEPAANEISNSLERRSESHTRALVCDADGRSAPRATAAASRAPPPRERTRYRAEPRRRR